MAASLPLFAGMDRGTPPLIIGLLMAGFGLGFGLVGEVLILVIHNEVDPR